MDADNWAASKFTIRFERVPTDLVETGRLFRDDRGIRVAIFSPFLDLFPGKYGLLLNFSIRATLSPM